MVEHHHGLLRDRLTKRIKTGDDYAGGEGFFTHPRRQIVGAMHTPAHIEPPILHGRQLDDARRLLPGIGPRGSKGTA